MPANQQRVCHADEFAKIGLFGIKLERSCLVSEQGVSNDF